MRLSPDDLQRLQDASNEELLALPDMPPSNGGDGRLAFAAMLLAIAGAVIAEAALVGYTAKVEALINVRSGFHGMSPVTAIGLLTLAIATIATLRGRKRTNTAVAAFAIVLGTMILASQLAWREDVISLSFGKWMFGMPASLVGRTSVATAASIVSVAVGLMIHRVATSLATALSAFALGLAGLAVAGYLYGAAYLYAWPIFNTMGLNTAIALICLALAATLANLRDRAVACDEAGSDGQISPI